MTWIGDVFSEQGFSDPYLVSLLTSLSSLVGNALAIVCVDRIVTRKVMFVTSTLFAGLVATAFVVVANNAHIVLACLFSIAMTVSWTGIGIMSSDAFPYESRTTQLGFALSFGRCGSIVANAVNPLLLSQHLILPCAGMLLLFGSIVAWFGLDRQ
jgi:hypothetical protein